MEEDINSVAPEDCNQIIDEGAVVQIIMRGEDGDTLIPSNQLIQINTDEGQMQYLEVTNKDGETQYIQVTADGQAQLIQFTNTEQDDGVMTAELTDGCLSMVENQTIQEMTDEQLTVKEEQSDLVHVFNSETTESCVQDVAENDECIEEMVPEKKIKMEDVSEGDSSTVMQVVPSDDDTKAHLLTSTMTQETETGLSGDTGTAPESQVTADDDKPSAEVKPSSEAPKPHCPVPDLSSPIELESETIVTINSKKCLLKIDPDTGKVRAYPLKPPAPASGKRPRGRPRKIQNADNTKAQSGSQPVEKPSAAPTEQENSAAEGLLGLSESDGRRKSLRVKKKPHVLAEYEVGAIEGVEDPDEDDGAKLPADDKDVVISSVQTSERRGRGRPAKTPNTTNHLQNFLANLGLPVKRGRGRPRRYPPPGSANQIPTFIIPQPSGQAMVMKPVQGLAVKPRPGHVTILPAIKRDKSASLASSPPKFPPIIIQNADGTQTHIVASVPEDSKREMSENNSVICVTNGTSTTPTKPVTVVMEAGANTEKLDDGQGENKGSSEYDESLSPGQATSNTELSTPGVLPEQGDESIKVDEDQVEILQKVSEVAADGVDEAANQSLSATVTLASEEGATAVIEVPQNLVPLLISGKSEEPIKIGLKQTESDLEKLKCEKCNFQSYYMQQYQEHLSAIHEGEIFKCKCCHFSCFDEESLNEHYKVMHPKNVCSVCNFRAEHAYVVKRHMMRHNSKGCKCQLCGKTYKDRYILKMHIKMVHMPAEVLFECNVCSKKFTRKAHLKRHTRIHDPEKPYKCPFCDYRGCERSDVTKHVVIHNDPKYACEVCGKFFRHMKNKELHLKRHKGQRDYKCGVCDFYGYTFTDIRKHIDRKHADAKIVCGRCGSVFRSEHQLTEHSKTCVSSLITIKANDFSVLNEVTENKSSMGQISEAQIATDSRIFMEGNHDYIRVEQVNVDLEDEENVNLTDAQISETSVAESQLVEQQMSTGQVIHSVDPVILTRGNEIIHLPADIDQNMIEGATHIQISETGELIKIEGDLTSSAVIHDTVELARVGVLAPSVSLMDADQYNECVELQSKLAVNSAELADTGAQLVVDKAALDGQEELPMSQAQVLTGQVELVNTTIVEGDELGGKDDMQQGDLTEDKQQQADVLVDDTKIEADQELDSDTMLTEKATPNQ